METEVDRKIPFLNVCITRNDDGSLAHHVYRKKRHTCKYIHADSHHHPVQKMGVLNTLATRSKQISDPTHVDQELEHLTKVFINNYYNTKQIKENICNSQIIKLKTRKKEDVTKTIKIPYIKGTTDKNSNIL